MKIAISGASGFIGSHVAQYLRATGHTVIPMVRKDPTRAGSDGDYIKWDPDRGFIASADFENIDAVIHLAGENLAAGRWTSSVRSRIESSRIGGTRLIAKALADCQRGPRILLSGSAIGYYGDRGNEVVDETSTPGEGFLAHLCKEWEAVTSTASAAGIRVVQTRIGLVLGTTGGGLAKMLPIFRAGLGGPVGDGHQYWSWVSLEDLARVFEFLLLTEAISGPVNCVSPNPVTNIEFTQALGRVLHRPVLLPAPALALRLLMGEMATELLLASQRVNPRVLHDAGFSFDTPEIQEALAESCGSGEEKLRTCLECTGWKELSVCFNLVKAAWRAALPGLYPKLTFSDC